MSEVKSKKPSVNTKKTSQFHFVINTNVSYKSIANVWSKEQKHAFTTRITDVVTYMRNHIDKFMKGKDVSKSDINKFKAFLEIGPKNGFIHVDGYCFMNKYCQFDNTFTSRFLTAALAPYSNGAHWDVRFVPNPIQYVEEYASKDDSSLL